MTEELHQRKIGFLSLMESIDTTNASGELIFHIFGALAEFEHSLITELTKAGLTAAHARGRKGDRPPPCQHRISRKLWPCWLTP